MARLAFYAPLKSPRHPVPSGEREMARNLFQALEGRGHEIALVSEFRSLEKRGDASAQAALIKDATQEADRLIAAGNLAAWVTYHSYYKAPDLIGPAVCDALNLPYLAIEATRASKRLGGPWDRFEHYAARACDRADVLFHVTARDAVALRRHLRSGQKLVPLAPFLARTDLPEQARPDGPTILLVGMMREGDKLASYKIAARVLRRLPPGNWQVEIAGDGPARPQVQAAMSPLGGRVRFLGQLDRGGLDLAYRRACAFFWPGVNEAFGMVYLEAQAAGVPVIAENRDGVCDVVAPDGLCPVGDEQALADRLQALLNDPVHRAARVRAARERIAARHLLGGARDTLWSALSPLIPEAT